MVIDRLVYSQSIRSKFQLLRIDNWTIWRKPSFLLYSGKGTDIAPGFSVFSIGSGDFEESQQETWSVSLVNSVRHERISLDSIRPFTRSYRVLTDGWPAERLTMRGRYLLNMRLKNA